MNDEFLQALFDLKTSIDKQNELQEENNGILRSVDDAVRGLAQELADARNENQHEN